MSGGGGGNNSAMMMMMMQQQAQQAAAAAEAEQRRQEQAAVQAQAQREYDAQQAALNYSHQVDSTASQRQYEEAQALRAQQEQDRRDAADRDYATQTAAQKRQQEIEDRDYQAAAAKAAQDKIDAAALQAKNDAATKLASWQTGRQATFQGVQNDANATLASMGVTDPSVRSAIMSALGTANAGIQDNDPNVSSAFNGIVDKVLGQQTSAYQTKNLNSLNTLLPQGFETSKIGDDIDDSILQGILGDQYNEAAAQNKRLLDRGVITQEGYAANDKQLGTQRTQGLSKLTTLGNNELSSERTKLGNIANQGRAAAQASTLGQAFDPNKYATDINSAYDKWFSGLDQTLRGIAPTDLFDTSSFLNTAGSVSGPSNSPFVGSTNALTGLDANTDTKKKNGMDTTSNALGVF